jgi:large conductance mechanosensitive channel
MSSSELNEGDATLIKTKVTVEQTTTTVNPQESSAKAEFVDLRSDFSKVGKGALKSLEGFRTFILRGNVVDLAIGIVIGAAFTSVVTAFVGDIITPLIPVSKTGSLSNLHVIIPHTYINLGVGAFINAVISFLIVAAVLYFFVVQPVNRLMKLYHPKDEEAKAMRDCPYCFQSVHVLATRCPFCTSLLVEVEEKEKGKEKGKEPVLMLPEELEKLSTKLADQIVRKATSKLENLPEASGEGAAAKE